MPGSVDLQLATLASQPPSGEEWLSEIKLDGYRIACHIAEGKARLRVVQIGETNGDSVRVVSGLASGEAVALDHQNELYDGAPVRVR